MRLGVRYFVMAKEDTVCFIRIRSENVNDLTYSIFSLLFLLAKQTSATLYMVVCCTEVKCPMILPSPDTNEARNEIHSPNLLAR